MVRFKKSLKKGFFAAFLFLLLGIAFWPGNALAGDISLDVVQSRDPYPAGGSYPILFRIHVAKGLYVHSTEDAGEGLIPTALSFSSSQGISIVDIRFPEPRRERFPYTSKPVEVYSGELSVRAVMRVSGVTPPGQHEVAGTLSYQACSPRSCLPPEKVGFRYDVPVVPPGTPSEALNQGLFAAQETHAFTTLQGKAGLSLDAGFWLALVGIFLGGLALNLTPCIYPLIPITVSYFGGRSRENCGPSCLHGLLYVLGLAITNSALGLAAALSGGMLGAVLQNPIVLIGVAMILLLLGSSFFGVWELRMPSGLTNAASRHFGGYFGTFFMGLTIGIVAAPCLGPFIFGLLTYVGQRGDPFLGFIYFFVLSIGLGLPLALLAVFSGALDKLPLSGVWMVWIRKGLGWVLVGMAAYMVWPLIPGPVGKSALVAAVSIAAGLHLGWLERSGDRRNRGLNYVKKSTGTFLIIGALVFFATGFRTDKGIEWTSYHPDLIEQASDENRPVMLDFYADWCTPCREMEKLVFTDPEVVELSQRFMAVRMDLTSHNPHQEALLKRFDVRGVPTIIFLNGNGHELKSLRIASFVERAELLNRMKRVLEEGGSMVPKT